MSEGGSRRPRRAVPHVREFLADSLTPLAVYRRLAAISPYRFLFESVAGGERVSRFSFLGAAPREIYRLYPDRLEVERKGQSETPARRAARGPARGRSRRSRPSPARSRSPAASSATSATT